jgi:hypothetical protein
MSTSLLENIQYIGRENHDLTQLGKWLAEPTLCLLMEDRKGIIHRN